MLLRPGAVCGMTPDLFRQAQSRLSVGNAQLADWLDCAPEHISRMRHGKKPVTKLTAFALKALETGLRPD